ncbi:MAG: hypothetical protein UR30_C0005G0108 [Candidatus Peregrinibacteria bacterium GW2011_GWC2_33_13]|nr:MAG: hypothetical protein UR30_C0005G0108 [Candidatus Peregrinibacteria bacterium GW2011_GWC2_33_13]
MTEIQKTKNKKWGFYGTIKHDCTTKKEVEKKWAEAFITLKELSDLPNDIIRRFLDSQAGRHLADRCYDQGEVANTIRKEWDGFKRTIFSREYEVSDEEFY